MTMYVSIGNLQVASILYDFVNSEALPGLDISIDQFWESFDHLIEELAPENRALLEERDKLQTAINTWYKENLEDFNFNHYRDLLEQIGYLEPEVKDFQITTKNVDEEITSQAGPQLVVPIDNARYALNAANARWGSLYDALYGTDVISEDDGATRGNAYNPIRGAKVIQFAKDFLNQTIPLIHGLHGDVEQYSIIGDCLTATLRNGRITYLEDSTKVIGYRGAMEHPSAILFKNNGLHFEIQLDRNDRIGQTDHAGVKDIIIEAALTTIMDFEDSIAAVDAEDKVNVYRNWLGLCKGDLSVAFTKGKQILIRSLNRDRNYTSIQGEPITLSGRSLIFVRNVGHLMTSQAIIDRNGDEVPEGILDGVITALIAKHNLFGTPKYPLSAKGSLYIVKPKMHGSNEVAFANKLFDRIEDMLGFERNTIKIGVMDEERRTSLNLKACIREVKDRIVFINTGFLDRTGDEIHTSMEAGPMIRKNEMKSSTWLQSYEKSNVAIGLNCGLQGKAQIGKGMWAMPDLMADMLKQKVSHLQAGGNTAWVPSPTAATLHALHYHQINVNNVQNELAKSLNNYRNDILQLPIERNPTWSPKEIQQELDNNAQGILGYVVRWVNQGVGCSKVPDINNVGLMEDRATLRISSQHMANWLHHGVCTKEQVLETLMRMAKVVDEQNKEDTAYHPMAPDFEDSIAFQAAYDLIFKGYDQPNGYTEPILHQRRMEAKTKYRKKEQKS